jgi:hypothetical protein
MNSCSTAERSADDSEALWKPTPQGSTAFRPLSSTRIAASCWTANAWYASRQRRTDPMSCVLLHAVSQAVPCSALQCLQSMNEAEVRLLQC